MQNHSGMSPIDFIQSLKIESNITFIFNQIGENPKFESIIDLIQNPAINNSAALNNENQSIIKFL